MQLSCAILIILHLNAYPTDPYFNKVFIHGIKRLKETKLRLINKLISQVINLITFPIIL